MNSFNPILNKPALTARVGDMSQVAGVRRGFIYDGRARGVESLDFVTGGGLEFTVLPGRGMDITAARYNGVPLCFVTKAGLASADAYEPEGMGWLRGFFAGLLTTCGLRNVGDACDDEEPELGVVHHGLHGRLSNTGAENVGYSAAWEGGVYRLRASGRMREGVLHGVNMALTRTIETSLGEKSLRIHDIAENDGFDPQPLMLLYHINAGYPILGEASEMILPSRGVTVDGKPDGSNGYNAFTAPVHEGPQTVYWHDLAVKDGHTQAAIINRELGLGLYVKFNREQLPFFMEWKRLSEGDYVVGLEPANCEAVGRVEMRRRSGLEILAPGGRKEIDIEIGVLDGEGEIARFREETEQLPQRRAETN